MCSKKKLIVFVFGQLLFCWIKRLFEKRPEGLINKIMFSVAAIVLTCILVINIDIWCPSREIAIMKLSKQVSSGNNRLNGQRIAWLLFVLFLHCHPRSEAFIDDYTALFYSLAILLTLEARHIEKVGKQRGHKRYKQRCDDKIHLIKLS